MTSCLYTFIVSRIGLSSLKNEYNYHLGLVVGYICYLLKVSDYGFYLKYLRKFRHKFLNYQVEVKW